MVAITCVNSSTMINARVSAHADDARNKCDYSEAGRESRRRNNAAPSTLHPTLIGYVFPPWYTIILPGHSSDRKLILDMGVVTNANNSIKFVSSQLHSEQSITVRLYSQTMFHVLAAAASDLFPPL